MPPAAEPAPAPAGAGSSGRWQAALGIAISIFFLWWALRDVHARDVLAAMRAADPWWFIASVIVVTLTFPTRAARWRLLLATAAGRPLPWTPMWRATAAGYMANNILPLRAGEVARAWLGSRLVDLPVSTALSTIGVERVFDGVVVVMLLAIGIASPAFPSDAAVGGVDLRSIALGTAVLFVGALGVLALMAHWPERTVAPLERLLRRLLPARAGDWFARVLLNMVAGLSILKRPGDFARVLGWSFGVWGLNAVSYMLAFRAFGFDLPMASASVVLQGIVVFAVAIPSSPGFVGVFEQGVKMTLLLYGMSAATAVGFALAVHMAWWVPITVLGLVALARTGLGLGDLKRSRAA